MKIGRKRTGEPGTEHYKKPGRKPTKRQYLFRFNPVLSSTFDCFLEETGINKNTSIENSMRRNPMIQRIISGEKNDPEEEQFLEKLQKGLPYYGVMRIQWKEYHVYISLSLANAFDKAVEGTQSTSIDFINMLMMDDPSIAKIMLEREKIPIPNAIPITMAAQELGISRQHLDSLIKRGHISSISSDGISLVPIQEAKEQYSEYQATWRMNTKERVKMNKERILSRYKTRWKEYIEKEHAKQQS